MMRVKSQQQQGTTKKRVFRCRNPIQKLSIIQSAGCYNIFLNNLVYM